MQQVRDEYQTEVKKLATASAGQKSKDGLDITYITQTFSIDGKEGEAYQNIYAFNMKDKTYIITLAQPSGLELDKTLGEKIRDSIDGVNHVYLKELE